MIQCLAKRIGSWNLISHCLFALLKEPTHRNIIGLYLKEKLDSYLWLSVRGDHDGYLLVSLRCDHYSYLWLSVRGDHGGNCQRADCGPVLGGCIKV